MNHSSGPNSGGGGEVPWGAPFPSLHLWPIQDTFQMKMIHLPEGQRVGLRLESSITFLLLQVWWEKLMGGNRSK